MVNKTILGAILLLFSMAVFEASALALEGDGCTIDSLSLRVDGGPIGVKTGPYMVVQVTCDNMPTKEAYTYETTFFNILTQAKLSKERIKIRYSNRFLPLLGIEINAIEL